MLTGTVYVRRSEHLCRFDVTWCRGGSRISGAGCGAINKKVKQVSMDINKALTTGTSKLRPTINTIPFLFILK